MEPAPDALAPVPAYRTVLSSDNQNWMTPPVLVYEIEAWLGTPFMWDAAALLEASKSCMEHAYFGPDHRDPGLRDALAIRWAAYTAGPVWMNPPYGREVGRFTDKAVEAALDGLVVVVLVYARTGTSWFRRMVLSPAARTLVLLEGRVKFIDPATGKPAAQGATSESCVVVLGPGPRPSGQALEILWEAPWGRGVWP